MDYLLTGGKILSETYLWIKMDIWIRGHKIYRLGNPIRLEKGVKKIDVDGYHILPGLIYDEPLWPYLCNTRTYRNQMKNLINRGYTSIIDLIQWESSNSVSDMIRYHTALHVESPIDYTFRFIVPIEKLTPSIVREVAKQKIRQIIVKVKDENDMNRVPWQYLFEQSQYYGLSFVLYSQNSWFENKKSKKQVEEIRNYWYYLNHKYRKQNSFNHVFSPFDPDKSKYPNIYEQFLNGIRSAKSVGIYPQKGRICIGSDADLIVVPCSNYIEQNLSTPHILFIKGNCFLCPIDQPPIGNGNLLPTLSSFAYNDE